PERPGPPVFTPTGTTATGEPISSTSNGGGFSETRPTSEYPGTFSTSVGTTFGQSTGETVQETTAPDEEYYTTHQQPSSTLTGHYTPTTSTASGSPITTGADRIPSKQPPPTMPAESPTKYPLDLRPAYPGSSPARPVNYPNYQFPMLYETNYPMPNNNERQPDIYAQNIPSLDNNYLRPEYAGYFGHRPSGPSAPTGNMKPVDNTISSYGGTGPQRPIENKPSGYGGGPLRPSGSGSGPSSSGYVTRPPPVGASGSDGYKVTEDKPDLHSSKYRREYAFIS
ncbi:AAEL015299-PA, partial [Aedes aegypti]